MRSSHAAAHGASWVRRLVDNGLWRAAAVRHALLWLLCTYGCIHLLYYIGDEGPWLRLRDAIAFSADPPFNHRVLFVLIARAFRAVEPDLGIPASYFLSQIVAAGAAFFVIEPWARHFLGSAQAVWSRPLLLLLLIPTFTYWTFYDLGIVFFHTAALLALFRRCWGTYLLVFAAGTLNHENTVLLMPVAVLLRWQAGRLNRGAARWLLAQVTLYAAIRMTLFVLLPAPAAWQSGKLAYNLGLVTANPQALAKTAVWLLGWGAIVLVAGRRMPPDLARVGALLLAELMVTTIVFGQLNELRQFDAFLPVAVVAVLSALLPESRAPVVAAPRTEWRPVGRALSASRGTSVRVP